MKQVILLLTTGIGMLVVPATQASQQDGAINACKRSIRDTYGVSNFRKVFAERTGRDRFRVYGRVKSRGDRYPFSCQVKRGWVQSLRYEGPYGNYGNDYYYKDDTRARNIALSVSLAALAAAAIAASSENQPDNRNPDSSGSYPGDENYRPDGNPDKYRLEDSCGKELGGRIRREHGGVQRIEIHHSQILPSGPELTGTGRIQWQQYEPSILEFSCSFDNKGKVTYSSYSYY